MDELVTATYDRFGMKVAEETGLRSVGISFLSGCCTCPCLPLAPRAPTVNLNKKTDFFYLPGPPTYQARSVPVCAAKLHDFNTMKIAVFLLVGISSTLIVLSSAHPGRSHDDEKHSEHHSQESGSKKGGKHVAGDAYEEGGGGDSSYHSGKHDRESGRYGSDGNESHGVEDEEQAGKNHKHYHADKHESFHKSGGESAHGAKYEEASNRHKGNYKKGYKDKFHKDELMRHNSFFNKGEKTGSYEIFGKKGTKFDKQSVSKKSGGTKKNVKSEKKHGKSDQKHRGHNRGDRKGYKSAKSTKHHYSNGDSYGKKGAKKGGKHYQYFH
ncbi:hypothetical protein HUJ04_003413 [Dendroctonus ponderosae]